MTPHARKHQRLREQKRRVTALFEELAGMWITSEEVAACASVPLRAAASVASQLAAVGAVEKRTVFWTAAKHRRRDRFEFALLPTGGQAYRQRLPEWLEPTVHPVNQAHCRLVAGRVSNIYEGATPMNLHEYQSLPRHIRERFSAIPDRDFDSHQKVVAARKRIEQAAAGHRAACEKAHQMRTRREQVEAFGGTCRTKAQQFQEHRIQNLADALAIQGTDILVTVDTEVRDHIERFTVLAEAVPVAIGQMDKQLVELNRRIQTAANDCSTAEENLRGVLDSLKLEEARRQAT